MTLPRALKLVLMFLASEAFRCCTYDLNIRSEPAKSTNINLFYLWLLPSVTVCFKTTTQWLLLDLSLRAWLLAVLVASIKIITSIISYWLVIYFQTCPYVSNVLFLAGFRPFPSSRMGGLNTPGLALTLAPKPAIATSLLRLSRS